MTPGCKRDEKGRFLPTKVTVPSRGDYTGPSCYGLPTCHLPGTEAKVRVLMKRARAGLALFHPRDRQLRDLGPGLEPEIDSGGLPGKGGLRSYLGRQYRRFLEALDEVINPE